MRRPKFQRGVFVAVFGLGLFCASASDAQTLVISEFMANNDTTIQDENGDYTDWIEIANVSSGTVSMGGWFLTDSATNLSKWAFPSTNLPPGGFCVIFASDKDRDVAGSELHANFKLAAGGEYLALVEPGGLSTATAFDPEYPALGSDQSYGFGQSSGSLRVLDTGTDCRWTVPDDGSEDATWRELGFDDGAWSPGFTGLGYERSSGYDPYFATDVESDLYDENRTLYMRVPFEVANPQNISELELGIRYDDGFIAYLNGSLVASGNAPSSPNWESRATSTHSDSAAIVFQTYTVSDPPSVLVSGTNVLAIHGLNRSFRSSDFLISPVIDGVRILGGQAQEGYLGSPTPGFANTSASPPAAPPVQIEPASYLFTTSFSVQCSVTNVPGIEIRYTLDGSAPDLSSALYSSPIPVATTTTVRARSFLEGFSNGSIAQEMYHQLAADLVGFSSDLPIVLVDTLGDGTVSSTEQVPGFITVLDRGANGRAAMTNAPQLASRAGIRRRGESSLRSLSTKPNFSVEAWNDEDDDVDVQFLDLPEDSDFILYAPYSLDRAYINNPLIYQFSNDMGVYAVRTRWVETFLRPDDDEPLSYAEHYNGLYVLMERIKRGGDRVDVTSMNAADVAEPGISGGYMFKKDKPDPGRTSFTGGGFSGLYYEYPTDEKITGAQKTWIKSFLDEFGNALDNVSYTNLVTGYRAFFRTAPSIDHHILNVMSKNADALRISTYMRKERGERFMFGPVWDFDRSMDSTDSRDDDPTGWAGGTSYFTYEWWNTFFDDPDFAQEWVDRWQMWRASTLSDSNIVANVHAMSNEVWEAQARNFAKWTDTPPRFDGYAGELEHIMDWLAQRTAWIDGHFHERPAIAPASGTFVVPPNISISVPAGTTVYYTTNGIDPRAPGGAVAASAITYTGSFSVAQSAVILARAHDGTTYTGWDDAPWSGLSRAPISIGAPRLTLTELMYHPAAPGPGDTNASTEADLEYVEFANTGTGTLLLDSYRITDGVDFDFSGGAVTRLVPGEYVVVVANPDAFGDRYTNQNIQIAGRFDGSLANDGEELRVDDAAGQTQILFRYKDSRGWPVSADGAGHALISQSFGAVTNGELDQGSAWLAGAYRHGSPGVAEPTIVTNLLLNEFVAHSDLDLPPYDSNDSIELLHAGAGASVSFDDWYLSDRVDDLKLWPLSSGLLAPGAFLAFDEITGFHSPITSGFGLNKAGEAIYLSYLPGTSADRVADAVRFKGQLNGFSEGRFPDASPYWVMTQITTGAPNVLAASPVRIDELMYHPAPTAPHPEDNTHDEYVELWNASASKVDLWTGSGSYRIDGGIDYSFPTGVVLNADERLVLVSFDPANSTDVAQFVAAHGLSNAPPRLYGPYTGTLGNGGGRVALEAAQASDDPLFPSAISWVVLDEVLYGGGSPWPTGVRATGRPIQRLPIPGPGSLPTSWTDTVDATPGVAASSLFAAPRIEVQLPQNVTISSAVARASLLDTGFGATYVDVYWGGSDVGTNAVAWANSMSLGARSAGAQSQVIAPIISGQTNWYRFRASNSVSAVWSSHAQGLIATETWLEAFDADASETGPDVGVVRMRRIPAVGAVAQAVHVSASGSALAGVDYMTLSTQYVFSSGSAQMDVTVTPVDDALYNESSESVSLRLEPGAYGSSPDESVVWISDNDIIPAALLAYAPFDYPGESAVNGQPVSADRTGFGFLGTWTGSVWQVDGENLVYRDADGRWLARSGGSARTVDDQFARVDRMLALTDSRFDVFKTPGGTIGAEGTRLWVSALIAQDAGGVIGGTFFNAAAAIDAWSFLGRVTAPSGLGGGTAFVSRHVEPGHDGVHLIVARYTFSDSPGADRLDLYVDPRLNADPSQLVPDGTVLGDMTFDAVAVITDDARVIDEIRIGVTYADVTPIGLPPGALILVR